MIDTDMAKQILQGDDTHPDILQAFGLELLAEVKRLRQYVSELLTEFKVGHSAAWRRITEELN